MRILRTLTIAAPVAVLLGLLAPLAMAQDDFSTRDASKASNKKQAKEAAAAALFPNASRVDPGLGVTEKLGKQINDLLALVNNRGQEDQVIATGEKLSATSGANHLELALIFQAMGYAYLNKGDTAKGVELLQKSIGEDALSNNDQYQLMLVLAKSQIVAGQADAAMATLARVVSETKQDKPEYAGIRGRVDFSKKNYAQAAQDFEKSIAGSAKPDPAEQQMLESSYVELKQPDRAEKIAEDAVHANPNDKVSISNLAVIDQQAGQPEKAIAVWEDARKRGLLTTADDYRSLYALYSNVKGRESDSAAVINEGLTKGILQPNEEVYTILGQDYYFSNQTAQAIETYKKADAVSTDGEAELTLAKIYNNAGQLAEAKAAAQRALQKGVKQPEDARVIIQSTGSAKKTTRKK